MKRLKKKKRKMEKKNNRKYGSKRTKYDRPEYERTVYNTEEYDDSSSSSRGDYENRENDRGQDEADDDIDVDVYQGPKPKGTKCLSVVNCRIQTVVFTGSDQLFITTGNSNTTEIIAVTHPTRCIIPTPYPLKVEGAVATFVEERPLVCGGRSSIEDYHNDCFHYNIWNNSWSRGHATIERRFQATAVMIDSKTWWITGGFSGDKVYNTTEVYEPGVGFR
jgi:hypothetical protein